MRFASLMLLLLAGSAGAEERTVRLAGLADASRDVREATIEKLAASELTVAELVELLRHDDERVRRGVCDALTRRADPAAIPALLVHAPPGAAVAVVRIAERNRLELPAIARIAAPPMRARLKRAHAKRLREHLARAGSRLFLSRPQSHRPYMAGGAWSERELRAIIRDPEQPAGRRVRALHVAQLLVGNALHDDLAGLVVDADPAVRSAAIVLLWRLHTKPGNDILAAQLDRGQLNRAGDVFTLVSAADQGGSVGAKGRAHLERVIRKARPSVAADAARVLMKMDRKTAVRLLRDRVRTELRKKDRRPAAHFFLACGSPTPEFTRMAAESNEPLVLLAAERDTKRALAMLKPLLDPDPGPYEKVRVRVVSVQLRRHRGPWEDRVRYARGVLASDVAIWRAGGLNLLRGAPRELLKSLRPRIVLAMGEAHESVRVNAAILMMPDVQAQRVLWSALYDGDLRTAWIAGPPLDPELGRLTPVSERRRRAREALAALDRQ